MRGANGREACSHPSVKNGVVVAVVPCSRPYVAIQALSASKVDFGSVPCCMRALDLGVYVQIEAHEDGIDRCDVDLHSAVSAIGGLLEPLSDSQRRVVRLAETAAGQGAATAEHMAQLLTSKGYTVEQCTSRQGPSTVQWLHKRLHTFLLCTQAAGEGEPPTR
jgi:hypothetical protein